MGQETEPVFVTCGGHDAPVAIPYAVAQQMGFIKGIMEDWEVGLPSDNRLSIGAVHSADSLSRVCGWYDEKGRFEGCNKYMYLAGGCVNNGLSDLVCDVCTASFLQLPEASGKCPAMVWVLHSRTRSPLSGFILALPFVVFIFIPPQQTHPASKGSLCSQHWLVLRRLSHSVVWKLCFGPFVQSLQGRCCGEKWNGRPQ